MDESDETLPESADESAPPPAPAMRLAQHKFLALGVILAVIIGAGLIWLNEAVRQETKFQEAVDIAARTPPAPHVNSGGLAYRPPGAMPSKTASPVPTKPVPADE